MRGEGRDRRLVSVSPESLIYRRKSRRMNRTVLLPSKISCHAPNSTYHFGKNKRGPQPTLCSTPYFTQSGTLLAESRRQGFVSVVRLTLCFWVWAGAAGADVVAGMAHVTRVFLTRRRRELADVPRSHTTHHTTLRKRLTTRQTCH